MRGAGRSPARLATISVAWALAGACAAILALRCTRVASWLERELPGPRARLRGLLLRGAGASGEKHPDGVAALTRRLVGLPERAAAHYAAAWLRARNLSVALAPVPGGRVNVLALARGARAQDARVLLTTHVDVVPGGGGGGGGDGAEAARESPGRIAGRGAVDARGLMAAMMVAAARLGDARVAALFVAGEETDHAGMRAASAALPFAPALTLVNGEPTESRLATRQKGMLKLRVSARGVAAHSGYPHLGESAVDKLLDALGALRKREWPSGTTMNIGVVAGGSAANVVPAHASAQVMFRLAGPPGPVLEDVRRAVRGVQVEVISQNGPVEFFAPPRAAEKFGTTEVAYNTDVAYYARPYRRAVLFGAGSIAVAHTEDEWIDVAELEQLPGRYAEIVREILALDAEE